MFNFWFIRVVASTYYRPSSVSQNVSVIPFECLNFRHLQWFNFFFVYNFANLKKYLKKCFHIHGYGGIPFQYSYNPTDIANHNLDSDILHHTQVKKTHFRNLKKMSNVEIYCGYLIKKKTCNLLYLRLLGAKFSWNLPSDSGEKLWKSKMSVDRETNRQWTQAINNKMSQNQIKFTDTNQNVSF